MQITGPLPVGPLGQNTALDLKPFQRVTAEILQVSSTSIVISIDGVPIVADVSSSELAASLKGRTSAQFIVAPMEDGKTVLRLVGAGHPGQAGPIQAAAAETNPNLAIQVLKGAGLPITPANQLAAQAAINQRLALQPGQLEQLLQTLNALPNWGASEANLAAAILAGGLPLSPQSMELASRPAGLSGETLASLLGQLRLALQDSKNPPEFKDLLNSVYQSLQEAILNPGAPADLPEKLAQAVHLLGRPIESLLAEEARSAQGAPPAGLANPSEALESSAGLPGMLLQGKNPAVTLTGLLEQLRQAVQDPQIPPEFREILKAVAQSLQENGLEPGLPSALREKLSQALNLASSLAGNLGAGGAQSSARTAAGLAAALLAAGLQLNPQALEQALRPADGGGAVLANLLGQLGQVLQDPQIPAELREKLGALFQSLQENNPSLPTTLREKLAQAQNLLNRLQENISTGTVQYSRQAAAAFLAAGLLLNPQGLDQATALPGTPLQGPGGGESLANLLGQLRQAIQDPNISAELREQLKAVFQSLQEAGLDPAGPAALPEKLARAINDMGRALENELAQAPGGRPSAAGQTGAGASLTTLVQLQQEAARAGKQELSNVLDDFWQGLRQAQWQNIPSNPARPGEEWLEAAIYMRLPVPEQGKENVPVRLRIARSPEGKSRKIDPGQANMLIQVEMPDRQIFQVEVGLHQHQVKADVTVPEAALYEAACQELPALEENLQRHGYSLSNPQVEIGTVTVPPKITVLPARNVATNSLNLEA